MIEGPGQRTPSQDQPSTALFRLAGYGGAGLFLRSVVIPADIPGVGARLAVDVELVSPQQMDRYSSRPFSAGLVDRLSVFFFGAASAWHPELKVPNLADEVLGLDLSVTQSDDERVALLIRIVEDPTQDVREFDGLDFETSRAALAQAGRDVRILDRVGCDRGGVAEPPTDWSLA